MFLVATLGAAGAETLHPGDRVSISVYNHPEFLTQAQLDPSGSVTLPLVGAVHISGLAVHDASVYLSNKMREYLRYADVDVTVLSPADSIYITGGPGGTTTTTDTGNTLPYSQNERLSSAVRSLTLPQSIDMRSVGLERDGKRLGTYNVIAPAAAADPILEPGDTIALANKPVAIAVLGDVKTPGNAYLYADEPLENALAQVGGPNTDAATGLVELTRDGTQRRIAPGASDLAQPAQPGDVLTVPAAVHVSVTGVVAKPGDVALTEGNTLIAAIYEAGGPLDASDISHVQVLHDGTRTQYDVTAIERGDLTQNPKLSSGDLVFVPTGHRINASTIFGAAGVVRYFFI
jgi:protein involved in polysaccharide export with SLBB domain